MMMENCMKMTVADLLVAMQNRIMKKSTYFGVKAEKSPMDAWVYQEIIFETKPDVIIEIGNLRGGGLLAYAHLCDLLGRGRIIGVDQNHKQIAPAVRSHKRITFVTGDCVKMYSAVAVMIKPADRVMIIEDSAHTYQNTLNVLNIYSPLVSSGCYFIVEDSICRHGLRLGPTPGPYEAIETFIKSNGNFIIDREREGFLITWNPKGYLKKI